MRPNSAVAFSVYICIRTPHLRGDGLPTIGLLNGAQSCCECHKVSQLPIDDKRHSSREGAAAEGALRLGALQLRKAVQAPIVACAHA